MSTLPPGFNIPSPGFGFLDSLRQIPRHWRAYLNILLFALIVGGAIFLAEVSDWPGIGNVQVQVGEISQNAVRAPRPITYQSAILTEQARERARKSVEPIFDPPETRVARNQIARAQEISAYISLVRRDPYASVDQKIAWLRAIPDLSFSEEQASLLLQLDDESWQEISNEVFHILDRVMRQEIREGAEDDARRTVPALISLDLTDDQAEVVRTIVDGLIVANTFYNDALTKVAQEQAASQVQPINRTIAAGETILRAGDRVAPLDMEALDALGLLRPRRTWRDYLAAFVVALLVNGVLIAFVSLRRRNFWSEKLHVYLLAVLFGSFVLMAKAMVPTHTLLPYLFPLASMAMLIGSLIELPIAMVATALVVMLAGQFAGGEMEILGFLFLGGVSGALALGKAERLNSFVRAGLWVILVNILSLLAFRLPQLATLNNQGLIELIFAGAVNGIFASSFTLVIYYMLGQLLGVTTSLQLLEISRPNHPLLRQLLLKAPGTYHHTLIVSNMAEEAAVAVGADSLLTRVGSYYHDIGKIVRPYFFIENSIDSENPHDRIDPYTSARIIISHVTDGVQLAEKYHLPPAIIDFIREHHGTTRVEYFYHKAVQMHESSNVVDESAFRYPGPKPRSRETAILMLADGCEATIRAMRPQTQEETLEIVRSVISRRLMSGQLDDSPLTLRDMSAITDAFARVLQGIRHPRIKYPEDDIKKNQVSGAVADAATAVVAAHPH